MNPYVTGQTIQMLRERRSMTQKQLAERIFVSDKTISKWETGKGLPDITLLESLAKALGVSLPELFSGTEIVNRNRTANMLKTQVVCVFGVRKCDLRHWCWRFPLLRNRPAAAHAGGAGRGARHSDHTHGRGVLRAHGAPHDQDPLSLVFRSGDGGACDAGEALSGAGAGNTAAGKGTGLAVRLL